MTHTTKGSKRLYKQFKADRRWATRVNWKLQRAWLKFQSGLEKAALELAQTSIASFIRKDKDRASATDPAGLGFIYSDWRGQNDGWRFEQRPVISLVSTETINAGRKKFVLTLTRLCLEPTITINTTVYIFGLVVLGFDGHATPVGTVLYWSYGSLTFQYQLLVQSMVLLDPTNAGSLDILSRSVAMYAQSFPGHVMTQLGLLAYSLRQAWALFKFAWIHRYDQVRFNQWTARIIIGVYWFGSTVVVLYWVIPVVWSVSYYGWSALLAFVLRTVAIPERADGVNPDHTKGTAYSPNERHKTSRSWFNVYATRTPPQPQQRTPREALRHTVGLIGEMQSADARAIEEANNRARAARELASVKPTPENVNRMNWANGEADSLIRHNVDRQKHYAEITRGAIMVTEGEVQPPVHHRTTVVEGVSDGVYYGMTKVFDSPRGQELLTDMTEASMVGTGKEVSRRATARATGRTQPDAELIKPPKSLAIKAPQRGLACDGTPPTPTGDPMYPIA